ncbi:MAG: hypothetical protein QW802_01395 [Candidatus Altiarchaeota archaeon]
MNILLLNIKDLNNAEYERKERKNLLRTEFGVCDTVAFCGKLEKVEKTDYGPRFTINDTDIITVIIGTFNKNVREDAEKIMKEFDKDKEQYVLIYGNPYKADKLYINVNNDNGVLLVDKRVYEKFHEIRERSNKYLLEKNKEKIDKKQKILSSEEILNFIKKRKTAKIEEIEEEFSNFDKEFIYEKILELLETGKVYEPKAGLISII